MSPELENLQLFQLLYLIELRNEVLKDNDNLNKASILAILKEDDIYQAINQIYAKETGIKLGTIDDKTKKMLHSYALEKSRYQLFNDLIQQAINRFVIKEKFDDDSTVDNRDPFVCENFEAIINLINEEIAISIRSRQKNNGEENEEGLPKITREEADKIIIEILSEVDPTLEWLEIYQKVKTDEKIIYHSDLTEEKILYGQGSSVIQSKEGIPYIFINEKGTIRDIASFLHEFAHYINLTKNNNTVVQPTLNEFSSIFYELYTLYFLFRKGYPKEVIYQMNAWRLNDTNKCSIQSASIFEYIKIYLENNGIKEADEIARCEETVNYLRALHADNPEVYKKHAEFFDATSFAHAQCDATIRYLIIEPWLIYKAYGYVIGTYLATQAMNTIISGNNILGEIKFYTENAGIINPLEVFIGVGCNLDKLGFKVTETANPVKEYTHKPTENQQNETN